MARRTASSSRMLQEAGGRAGGVHEQQHNSSQPQTSLDRALLCPALPSPSPARPPQGTGLT